MTACTVRSRRVWQSAAVGLTLLLVPAWPPARAEPKTRAQSHESAHAIECASTRVGQQLVISLPIADTPMATPRLRPRSQALLSQPPPNLILQLPDFGERLPMFLWPVHGPVTSGFGLRRSGWHKGIDIKADRGAFIAASAPGRVIASGVEKRYGYVVKIQHLDGFVTVYAHNQQNFVRIGDRVLAGQTIAAIGRSGRATAPHLHFEIRHGGCTYDPLYLLNWPHVVAASGRVSSHDDSLYD
jgi:murein DD-endopeptidase MepM/ murein hydrolase activator NlpD